MLGETVHIKPSEMKWTKAVVDSQEGKLSGTWLMSPNEGQLAKEQCDLTETLLEDATTMVRIPLHNWGTNPIIVRKGTVIGNMEEVSLISRDDPFWIDDQTSKMVRVCHSDSAEANRVEKLCSELQFGNSCTSQNKNNFSQIVRKHNDVFALNDAELGETDVVTHAIDTGTAQPVKATARRLPYALCKELEEEMDSLLQSGCIEPSVSPYSSPLVLVRKKSGGLRVCVDYRALNRDTVPDRYPLPRIDELMDMVGRQHAKVFSSLDLMKDYHQVKMDDSSKPKTVFVCHLGLYQYRRMPFGLTNAPATFQRLMGKLFNGKDFDFVFVYLDDILVASQTVKEHLDHLQKVFQRLRESGLRLKPSKCVFATEEVEYLGHTLTPEGVKPNERNVEAITYF